MSKSKKKSSKDARNQVAKQERTVRKKVRRKKHLRPNQSEAWRHSTEIAESYQAGKSLRELVLWVKSTYQITVSHQTISEILKAEGLTLRSRGGAKKSQIWEHANEIAEEYKRGGTSTVKLAAKYGSSPANIATILRSEGVKLYPFSGRKISKAWKLESEIINDYFQKKISQQKLAAKYSCSLTTIGKILGKVKKNK